MTDSSTSTRPASPVGFLSAPQMSASSSKSSHFSNNFWSAQPSRRGSDASSIAAPSFETLSSSSKETAKEASAPATAPLPTEPVTAPAAPAPTRRHTPLVHSGDPLRRTYPKPEGDLDVGEALAREPLRWSLGHWRKHARDVVVPTVHSEVSKKRFQDAKDDLLRSHASLQSQNK